MARYRIGVDVGGTFTDFVIFQEETNEVSLIKVSSTPKEPSEAIQNGIYQFLQRGINPDEIVFFSHGTTVGTNALLEDKGAKVGVLVTEGFRGINDVYQGATAGPSLYDIYAEMPKALVPPSLCEEICERVDFKGKVIIPLDEEEAKQAMAKLVHKNVESIAICLLFSFMNLSHETRIKEIAKQLYPKLHVSTSVAVIPQIREYLRLSTTIVNAKIAPVMSKYLSSLEDKLSQAGITTNQKYVMQCNGGVSTFGIASIKAVPTILSGPAAGVIAGSQLGLQAGYKDIITFDMGGTSTDVALVESGEAVQVTVGQVGKWEVATAMLDINTIGAGGGSIAWIDKLGVPKVGPQSAGADPGPACYDKGGNEPTVTDADLLLGYINPDNFLGGKIRLNRKKSEEAILAKIGRPLKLETIKAAEGMVRIVNTNMEQAIKAVSTERGYDLRQFTLIAFGGAGPVHASMLAVALGIPRVLIPPAPGLTSAMGLLMSDVRHDYARSRLGLLTEIDPHIINEQFYELGSQAVRDLVEEGFSEKDVELSRYLDLRYYGQGYELTIPTPNGRFEQSGLALIRAKFDATHERLFGHKAETEPVEIVNYRLVSQVKVPKFVNREYESAKQSVDTTIKGKRHIFFGEFGQDTDCLIYDRNLLRPGHLIMGPAIIEQMDSTTVVCPGQAARVDKYGNIIISIKGDI